MFSSLIDPDYLKSAGFNLHSNRSVILFVKEFIFHNVFTFEAFKKRSKVGNR